MAVTPSLLIIWHSRTGASEQMALAASKGAGGQAIIKNASDVTADDILTAGAYLFVCPENLGSLSGLMKDMFDRTYYPALGRIEGRAYATLIAAGSDGHGATRQIDRIVTGWRLKRCADPVIINCDAQDPAAILAPKSVGTKQLEICRNLGLGMQEGLALGIY